LNGQVEAVEPILMPLIDREVSLYNKTTRRNHLMYGASTYTPVVTGLLEEDQQDTVTESGLGSYLFLPEGVTIDILQTPSAALSDMAVVIEKTVDEMAKMGIRMLSPETSGTSGTALEIRNASQTAQLGTLNTKISEVMSGVITFMINWRFGSDLEPSQVNYSLSADFSPTAGGEAAMRLVTEWYQSGIIPRSTFLDIARFNDFIPADYDDIKAQDEIERDPLVTSEADLNEREDNAIPIEK